MNNVNRFGTQNIQAITLHFGTGDIRQLQGNDNDVAKCSYKVIIMLLQLVNVALWYYFQKQRLEYTWYHITFHLINNYWAHPLPAQCWRMSRILLEGWIVAAFTQRSFDCCLISTSELTFMRFHSFEQSSTFFLPSYFNSRSISLEYDGEASPTSKRCLLTSIGFLELSQEASPSAQSPVELTLIQMAIIRTISWKKKRKKYR